MLKSGYSDYYGRLKTKLHSFLKKENLGLVLAYLSPTGIPGQKSLLAPLVACAALLGLIVSSLWALGALLQLFMALVLAYFILTKVFEIRFDIGTVR